MDNKAHLVSQIRDKLLNRDPADIKAKEASQMESGSGSSALPEGAEVAFANYEVKKIIGEGSFGLVFKAK